MIGLWSIGMMASGAGGRYRQIRRCIFQELTEKINEASFNYWDNWTGWLLASPEDKYKTIIRVAASDMSEDELAQWIRKNLEKIKS